MLHEREKPPPRLGSDGLKHSSEASAGPRDGIVGAGKQADVGDGLDVDPRLGTNRNLTPQTPAHRASDSRNGFSNTNCQPDQERRSCERNLRLGNSCGPLDVPPGLSNGLGGRRCEGLDPREVSTDVLTAAGHPSRETRQLVNAFNQVMGGEIFSTAFNRIKRHKHIRAFCLECVDGNAAEVRRCCTFWCPFWPYRMGSNPHRPERELSDEQRAEIAERLRRARGAAQ